MKFVMALLEAYDQKPRPARRSTELKAILRAGALVSLARASFFRAILCRRGGNTNIMADPSREPATVPIVATSRTLEQIPPIKASRAIVTLCTLNAFFMPGRSF